MKTQWGVWRLENSRLIHYGEGEGHWSNRYSVNLEAMNTAAQMLDWIFQVSSKTWATREDVGNLIEALDDIFGPQGSLCSGGMGETVNAAEVLDRYMK